MTRPSHEYLRGQRIDPAPIDGRETVADLIDNAFLAYNAGRLREGCQLFTRRMLEPDVTVGMTLTGAMTRKSSTSTLTRRRCRKLRTAPATVANTTSFRLTSYLFLTSFTFTRSIASQSKRRCGPIG